MKYRALSTYNRITKEWELPPIVKTTNKRTKVPKHRSAPGTYPFAINFLHLQDYHFFEDLSKSKAERKTWSISTMEEATILEYFLMMSNHYFNKFNSISFYKSFLDIKNETGVSRTKIFEIVNKFERRLRIINTCVNDTSKPRSTIFQINYVMLAKLLPKIVMEDHEDDEERHHAMRYKQRLEHFQHMNSRQEKQINQENED